MKRKILSLFLALALCLSLLPAAAVASEVQDPVPEQTEAAPAPEEAEDPVQEEPAPEEASAEEPAEAGEKTLIQGQPTEPETEPAPEAEQALAVYAAGTETHEHFLCGGADCDQEGHAKEENKTAFEAWDWSSTNGTYYLTNSGSLNGTITVPSGSSLTLCLNGYDIMMGSVQGEDVITVEPGATFTLCDCKRGGTVTDYGTIGHRDPQSYNGSGVSVETGTFNMYGGKIANNTVGYFTDGISRGYGGGVRVYNKGIFNMIGGEITGNTAKLGGGVNVGAAYGLHDNTDEDIGGTFNMTGGEIYGNICTSNGGGVYACASSKLHFTVSGSVQITDNYTGSYFGSSSTDGAANNVYLEAGGDQYPSATIEVGTLAGAASIGVTTKNVGQTAATGVSAANAKRFSSDAGDRRLQHDSDAQTLTMVASTHENHPICGDVNCTDSAHALPTGGTWMGVDSLSEITSTGRYYLTKNVTLTKTFTPKYDTTLCLNGYTITADGDFDAITVGDGKTFTLCDCVGGGEITHAAGKTGSGVYVEGVSSKAAFNMYGGTITGNMGHTVTVKNVDSTCGGGVYVASSAQFSMRGGSITENTADVGGGVYYTASNNLFVSGKVNITGNKDTSGAASNVNVPTSNFADPKTTPFYIGDDGLDTAAEIGVRLASEVIATGEHSPVAQLGTYASETSAYHDGNFLADNEGDYSFKLAAREQDTITSRYVVNIYNGLHEHPICGETCTDGAHTGDSNILTWIGVSSLDDIKANEDGTTAYYFLTQDITTSASWTAPDNVVLCLNGYGITSTMTATSSNTIIVNGTTFTLTDCNGSGSVRYFTENSSGRWESATKDAEGAFHVSGGGIFHKSGDYATYGVSLRNGGTFRMYGGTICGSWCGVYANSGCTMTVSGDVKITGNASYNVYLNDVITVGGKLSETAKIGVTVFGTTITSGSYVTVAKSADGSALTDADGEHFVSDTGYKTQIRDGKIAFVNGELHEHPLCGETCAHAGDEKHTDDLLWEPLTSEDGVLYHDGYRVSTTSSNSGLKTTYYILPAGNYYLPESITIDKPILISSNMNLCLNGKTLSTTLDQGSQDLTLIAVYQDKTLNLCDCDAEGKGTLKTENNLTFGVEIWYPFASGHTGGTFNMYGGTITGVQRGVRLYVESNGGKSTFKMYDGTITGTKRGVYVNDGSIFEMYGGEITTNNTQPTLTENKEYFGGGVVVDIGATFTMKGGTISNNNAYSGGGVCLLGKSGSATTTFNMEGGTITGNTTSDGGGGGVYLGTNTAFNMSGDATVSGNTAGGSCGGGVYVNTSGSFTMSGNSTISGNTTKYGGGVYLAGGMFTMSENAAIFGNNAGRDKYAGEGGGVCVTTGTFNMTGGSITGNNVYLGSEAPESEGGGGVYVAENATMNVSGNVQIHDNWKNGTLNAETGVYENGSANNLYLYAYKDNNILKTVTIDSTKGLTSTAKIGVTTRYTPTADAPIQFATGATENLDYYTNIFTPDDPENKGYMITQEGSDLYLSAHTHDWQYTLSADGTTITAVCKDATCPSKDGGSVTINKPAHEVYRDGKSADAMLTKTGWTAGDVSITYKKDGTALGSAPINAGTYTASITMGDQTASVTYTIEKATLQASDFTFNPPANLTYDGKAKYTILVPSIGGVAVTPSYYNEKGENVSAIHAGTYTVRIDVTESENYKAATGLTDPNWTFTILTNNAEPDVTLSGDMVYSKTQLTPTATVAVNGTTLTEGRDYTVSYGTNMDAGTNTGNVTITAMGNYGFKKVIKNFNIAKRPITVTADDRTTRVGQELAELTYTCTEGLPYKDDEFSGALTTKADKNQAGTYDIEQGTLTLGDNYAITFNKGTYTVQAKLAQDKFKFADAEVTKTYGTADFAVTAGGQVTGSTVTYDSSDKTVATVDNSGTVHILKAGTTTITANASATADYAEATAEYALTVAPKTLTAKDLQANGSTTKTYDGNATAAGITVRVKDGVLVNGDELSITGSAVYNSKDVATANQITFTPDAITTGNYRLAAAETLTISGAKINARTISIKSVTAVPKQYDRDDTAWSCITGVTFDGLVEGETLTKGKDYGITKANFNSADVEEANKITGTVGLIDAPNYTFEDRGDGPTRQDFETACTITPADSWALTPVTDLTIRCTNRDAQTYTPDWSKLLPTGQKKWTYSSSAVTTGSAKLAKNEIGAESGVLSYQLSAGAENDTVTWTITASCGNYQPFTLTVTLTLIAREQQTNFKFENDTASVTKTYGDPDFTVAAIGAAEGSKVTYTSSNETVAKVDANGKVTIVSAGSATITAASSETKDYNEASISYDLTVEKKSVAIPAKDTTTFTYNGQAQTYALAENEDYTISGNTQTAANEAGYTVTVALKDPANTKWSDGTTDAKTYSFVIAKKSIAAPDEDTTAFTYTGEAQTYALTEDEAYTISGNTQTNANEAGYTVTVTLKDTENTKWADGTTDAKTYSFVIKKAVVTITVKDKRAYVGTDAPDLSKAAADEDYTVSGLIGTDTLGGTITLAYGADLDMTKIGTAAIKASGATASDNYTIQYVDGTLTIVKRPSSGGGSAVTPTYPVETPAKAENGSVSSDVKNATPGSTVTITVKSDSGYTLDSLTVTDSKGNELKLTDKGNGKYTFTMPDSKVTVKTSFTQETETSPFDDVAEDAYYYEAVKWANDQNITGGTGNGRFSPDASCTRAQIVTFLWRAAGAPEPKGSSTFSDVPASSYYAKAVAWAVENGITTGTGDGTTFSPDATCTRAQGMTFLYRAAKASASGAPAFLDVAADAWYAPAVKWATDNGITNGIGGSLFGSDNACTRAQIVTFLWRLYAGK